MLKKLVLRFGAYDAKGNIVNTIQNAEVETLVLKKGEKEAKLEPLTLKRFAEIEVRLRLSKLLGIFDLSCYADKKFKDLAEIEGEAARNIKRHTDEEFDKTVKVRGGVVFNPKPEDLPQPQKNFVNSFFRKTI